MLNFIFIFLMIPLIFFSEIAYSSPQENRSIILATTTSTVDTGILDVLIPVFEKKSGYRIKPIAVGTGEAISMGKRGEADILLVHSPDLEKKFVEDGYGINRKTIMHNDFVIVGPKEDKAGVKNSSSVLEAIKKIYQRNLLFVSRGDKSGTHILEKKLWDEINIKPSGSFYIESGQGMGETLRITDEKRAYTISDRGTYLALKSTLNNVILFEGDRRLVNLYSVIQVNPERFPRVNKKGSKAFLDFLSSHEVFQIIKNFGTGKYGQPLFYPETNCEVK